MKTGKGLLVLLMIFGVTTMLMPWWGKYFSKQNEIDPDNLIDEYDNKANRAIFDNKFINVPKMSFNDEKILGENQTSANNKRIEVDLTNQRTNAYEGDKLIYSFLISSGKWNRTPTGTFKIWTKIRSQKMSGGSKELGTYYYLPNVPYIMFFYNEKTAKKMGYSFHGTYWHNNFGVPMSHGCINMKTSEAAILYNWAEIGTEVTIHGKYRTNLPKT